MPSRHPIIPHRIRQIQRGFAFIPHRFLTDGFLTSLTSEERSLYLFLLLAADRQGISFYGYDRICAILELSFESYLFARDGLLEKDLIAFDGVRFQVLSLPPRPIYRQPGKPLESEEDFEAHDPATIRQIIVESLSEIK